MMMTRDEILQETREAPDVWRLEELLVAALELAPGLEEIEAGRGPRLSVVRGPSDGACAVCGGEVDEAREVRGVAEANDGRICSERCFRASIAIAQADTVPGQRLEDLVCGGGWEPEWGDAETVTSGAGLCASTGAAGHGDEEDEAAG